MEFCEVHSCYNGAGTAAGGNITIRASRVHDNRKGIILSGSSEMPYCSIVEYCEVTSNRTGVIVEWNAPGDLGGGPCSGEGGNQFYDNEWHDVRVGVNQQTAVYAQYNWWGDVTTAEMENEQYPSDIEAIYDDWDDDGQANGSLGMVDYRWWMPYLALPDDSCPAPPSSGQVITSWPNPFNPETTIRCRVPIAGHVDISVYDTTGGLVRTLVNKYLEAGEYEVRWFGEDENRHGVSSGVYFCRMEAGAFRHVWKLVLVR